MASIAKLGFDIKDVKVLLNSEPHPDHAGGLGALQQASGAELWASEASADAIAAGGDADIVLPLRALIWIGLVGYPATRVDHRFKDSDTIRVGPIALTAHVTSGHTRGCTSWSFPVRDGDRVLNVVSVCDTGVLGMSSYPEQTADRERSLRVLRSLPADIWVTNHARPWGRYRKFLARATAKNPVDPFIDPEGYRAFIDAAESELRQGVWWKHKFRTGRAPKPIRSTANRFSSRQLEAPSHQAAVIRSLDRSWLSSAPTPSGPGR